MQSSLISQPTGFQPPLPQSSGFQPPISQPTGFQPSVSQPLFSQPTGFQPSGPLMSQPTGLASGGFGGMNTGMNSLPPFQNSGTFSPIQPNPTGFNPGFGMNNVSPPPPSQPAVNTNPANVFASMKSGTFGSEDSVPQPAGKYDALRPNPTPMTMQATGWGGGYQGGYNGGYGFQH
ncbi:hypothetical protein NM688_g6553 [Phlebia brevispora]|uniref:Uncharacterized protein n=1 Tax=Phlebia brevispora TaxID=194682 RepID=A0ACC1SEZ9_9APHY|nr:hypothetical protein NM688_g6553 [Phlebia brevispora]